MKINWNWKVFILCPIWSFYNRFYFGCWIFIFPAISYGLLLTLMKVPLFEGFSVILIVFLNVLSAYFYAIVFGGISLVCKTGLLNSFIANNIVGAVYYIICSFWISVISADNLIKGKSQKISLININYRKWSRAELLITIPIIPLIIIINYINYSMIIMGLKIMP
jgi:hypothetical protein